MKLDDLLAEYSATLRPPGDPCGLPPLEELTRQAQRSGRGWWWASGAAAALVLVLAAPRAAREQPRMSGPAAQPPLHELARSASPAARPAPAVSLRPASVRLKRRRPTLPAEPPDQPFVPLIENSMLPAPALFQLVRVSVRPERLAELGIAWRRGGSTSAGLVDAEVLLGDDGIARAVRVPGAE